MAIDTLPERITALASQIKTGWELCQFMKNHGPRATEKEVMVCQTITACKINLERRGQAFSFDECDRGCHNGGLFDNGTAYAYLFDRGYFAHGEFEGKSTIIPTEKLVKALEAFFVADEASTAIVEATEPQ